MGLGDVFFAKITAFELGRDAEFLPCEGSVWWKRKGYPGWDERIEDSF